MRPQYEQQALCHHESLHPLAPCQDLCGDGDHSDSGRPLPACPPMGVVVDPPSSGMHRSTAPSPLFYPRPWGTHLRRREFSNPGPWGLCQRSLGAQTYLFPTFYALSVVYMPSRPSLRPSLCSLRWKEQGWPASISPHRLSPGPGCIPSKPGPASRVNKRGAHHPSSAVSQTPRWLLQSDGKVSPQL